MFQMSDDMSMFKKMRERITDEVNSATNKLQNMQIIDQLASSIGQQIKNETSNQLLPELHNSPNSHSTPINRQFSLISDGPVGSYMNEEEELNSEISPQHQLFNEHAIQRLEPSSSGTPGDNEALRGQNGNLNTWAASSFYDEAVINIQELSSDIEDGLDDILGTGTKEDRLDVEIDLLSDKPLSSNDVLSPNGNTDIGLSSIHLLHHRTKFKTVVHAIRKISTEFEAAKKTFEAEKHQLECHIAALKAELDDSRQQQHDNQHDSLSTNQSETDKSRVESPQISTKSHSKLRDLERLLAKCKESLKLKNSQIKELKESLSEIDEYKNLNQELKLELAELRSSHETWTVSIAENKRITHQEIESKNVEIENLKKETNDLQLRLTESHNKSRQLKSAIQDLESRLVSTSVAHQKERESLTKELTIAKNSALKQLQKEHEHNIERVKLDLEKSIEALKLEILTKDEHIIKSAEQQQQLRDKILSAETAKVELESRLDDLNSNGECQHCVELQQQIGLVTERFQQELHELNTRLNLMTTANDDQEKEIKLIKLERDSLSDGLRVLKSEFDDLHKKNESLCRIAEENEADMQTQQDQLDHLSSVSRELDSLRKENSSLSAILNQLRTEFHDRSTELAQLQGGAEELNNQLSKLKTELKDTHRTIDDLRSEKNALATQNENLCKQKKEIDRQLVIGILSAIKNLETPDTSPGSDKSCESTRQLVDTNRGPTDELVDTNRDTILPDPMALLGELSSLAFDKSNAFLRTTQRLQAVLLDNSMKGEELSRLKDELNNISKETLDNQTSQEQDPANKPDSTEFEYLKNIVHQFMLGKEPLVLARVISAIFKFDKNQVEQICKIQETVQSALKQSI